VGGVFIDNYQLLARHPDNRGHPELIEALRTGALELTALKRTAIACFVLAALTGPYLVIEAGWPVVVLGAVGMLASALYAGGPRPYAGLGLADALVFLVFGVVAVAGIYYVQAASLVGVEITLVAFPTLALVAGLPVGALVTNVLIIDDIRDREADAAKGWRTVAVRFGRGFSRAEFTILAVAAYLAPFWLWARFEVGAFVLLPLVTLPAAIWVAWRVCRRPPVDLAPITAHAAFLSLAYGLLLGTGIGLS
jgi:1,4-dihydroxy-2-naphthoate octaprenyltransferase